MFLLLLVWCRNHKKRLISLSRSEDEKMIENWKEFCRWLWERKESRKSQKLGGWHWTFHKCWNGGFKTTLSRFLGQHLDYINWKSWPNLIRLPPVSSPISVSSYFAGILSFHSLGGAVFYSLQKTWKEGGGPTFSIWVSHFQGGATGWFKERYTRNRNLRT